jgi:hypothetical protein
MKELYLHNGTAYLVMRRKSIESFSTKIGDNPNMEWVQMYMTWCGADHVLRDNSQFIFCETIKDVEFEEIKEEV